MTTTSDLDIFLVCPPGLEPALAKEVRALGFVRGKLAAGGVTVRGGWPEVWRANLMVRGASRVTVTLGSFRAQHLTDLEKRGRRFAWSEVLRDDVPFRVEATCKASRIYHSGAAAQRIEHSIRETLGAPVSAEAEVCVRVRIENDECFLGLDTSGELLHKRGHKEAVGKAPMRETMAALFLGQCGYEGSEPVLDPMCGAGTFVIEAAEIAAGLAPGRARHFAFEKLATFDRAAWETMRSAASTAGSVSIRFNGSDRDAGAIRMGRENAERAGVADLVTFTQRPVSELERPDGPPGLVIVNPPYGARIGEARKLLPLYRALGQTLGSRFAGWRVGLVTTETMLAQATGLPFLPPGPPVPHGGLRVKLYQTQPLP